MLLFVGAALAAPIALYAAARWCLGQIGRAAAEPAGRRLLGAAAGVAAGLLVAEQAGWRPVDRLRFADPVAPAYAREAYELAYEMSGAGVAALGPPPVLRSDLARVAGADVFVVFMESYGAVSWERPAFVEALAGTRMQLAADVRESAAESSRRGSNRRRSAASRGSRTSACSPARRSGKTGRTRGSWRRNATRW